MFEAITASEATGLGPVRHKGSGNPTLEPASGGRKIPSDGEVSDSGDSETRIYLVFNMGREVSLAGSLTTTTKWVIGR